MADETVVIEAPKATLFVERKVSPKQYESLTVGLHFPAELPVRLEADTNASYAAACGAAVAEAFAVLKVQVYDQLGIEYSDNAGIIAERIAEKVGGRVEATPRPQRSLAPQPEVDAVTGKLGPSKTPHEVFGLCPSCGGNEWWDNRVDKRNPKSPDGKCKLKDCDGVVWPPRKPR